VNEKSYFSSLKVENMEGMKAMRDTSSDAFGRRVIFKRIVKPLYTVDMDYNRVKKRIFL
jgi:hypothetical protein